MKESVSLLPSLRAGKLRLKELMIEFFSPEDLSHIAGILAERREEEAKLSAQAVASVEEVRAESGADQVPAAEEVPAAPAEEVDEDLYAVRNFTV